MCEATHAMLVRQTMVVALSQTTWVMDPPSFFCFWIGYILATFTMIMVVEQKCRIRYVVIMPEHAFIAIEI
jgi:hypothetical protein